MPLRTTRRLVAMVVAGPGLLPATSRPAEPSDAKVAPGKGVVHFVSNYCVECHGNKKSKAGLNLKAALTNPGSAAWIRLWKKARAHVKAHDMPPPEEADRLPTDEERRQFHEAIGQIKFLSPKDPGQFIIRLLTEVEFGNTLRDFLGADPKIAEALPDEVSRLSCFRWATMPDAELSAMAAAGKLRALRPVRRLRSAVAPARRTDAKGF